MGRSESIGATSPKSDLNGAPKRWRAVGEDSSDISYLTCWEMSSRLRSAVGQLAERLGAPEGKGSHSVLACRSGRVLEEAASWLMEGF